MQLLEDEINRLKGEPLDLTPDPELHLPIAAYLPETYIPDIDQRLMMYRRLSGRLSKAEIDALVEEMLDCYGPLTPEAANLLEVVQAKSILRDIGIKRLDMSDGLITVTFADGNHIDQTKLVAEVLKSPRRYQLTPGNQLRVRLQEGAPLDRLKKFLKEINFFVIAERNTPKRETTSAPKESLL